MVLSLLSPFQVAANGAENTFKAAQDAANVELKTAVAEQMNLAEGQPKLHEELKNLKGEKEVDVIVHLSEYSPSLLKGLAESHGKAFNKAQETKALKAINTQQNFVKKELTKKGIKFNETFAYNTVLNGFAGTLKAKDVEKLLEVEGVTLVEPNTEVHAAEVPKKSLKNKTLTPVKEEVTYSPAMNTSNDFLGIDQLWNAGLEGQGVKVAVLDTGIDADHPEFEGIYKGGKNFVPHDSKYSRDRDEDDASETLPSERAAGTPEFNANGSSFYTSHGTHVAGTIAAIGANEFGIKGIAPKVDLYAYRVLGAYGSGSTAGIIAAIEEAVTQEMDVINLSLGGGANSETDAGSFAINNAAMAGVVAALATGNSGPNRGTMGTPATARLGIAVGNTTNPEAMYSAIVNVAAGDYEFSKNVALMGTTFGANLETQLEGDFDLVAVPGVGTPADYNGLDVEGKFVLVSRGEIAFVDKIAAAKDAGAVGLLVHNNVGTGPAVVSLGDAFEFLPTFDMATEDGAAVRAALADAAGTVSFENVTSSMTTGDDVNDSSSRGPSTPNFDIKPDVSAPGTNIMSTIPMYKADFPDAVYDEAYSRKTGTSMATPHIAGVAALVIQANPEWDAFDVKVALSNTAEILDTEKYDVFAQGAGRVNAYAAAFPEVLAYAQDTAILDQSGEIVDNVKGTITFGPQDITTGDVSVSKEVIVTDMAGNGGDYSVEVLTTSAYEGAEVVVDQSSVALDANGEVVLTVTLNADQNAAAKTGDEILGYVVIADGDTEISLPFAADFGGAATAEITDMAIDKTDLSFDGDGFNDSARLTFTLTGDVGTNYIELWDIMNPEGGEFGDGYIGYVHFGQSLAAGSYSLNLTGQYQPWGGGAASTIPDGLYTIDFTGSTDSGYIGDYVGPVVVKTTDPVIDGAVEGDTVSGQVTDKYIEYNEELYLYGLDYDLNDKLSASYVATEGETAGEAVEFDLNQDGSFEFDVTAETTSVTVTVVDAAGNSAEQVVFEREVAQPEVTLTAAPGDLALTAGETADLTVTETTVFPDGETVEQDVTADATYTVADSSVTTVENGVVTAIAEGTTTITIAYGGNETTVSVTVEAAPVIEEGLFVDKEELELRLLKRDKVTVTLREVAEDGTVVESNVTSKVKYSSADPRIVSIMNGTFIGKKRGTTTVTISYEGYETTIEVTVR
ncbi:S8 family serine peptidase [Planomicrobium sp. YIM 101495]|nr:S8 family serine peptidase [Planomicrobium sp. YIM 101495]MTD30792.1 S8 family serine peptidase [Planomicrobium sp. YIM 101495]